MTDTTEIKGYVHEAIGGFVHDPPDTAYQRGYLAALLNVWLEGLDQDHDEITKAAERLIAAERSAS